MIDLGVYYPRHWEYLDNIKIKSDFDILRHLNSFLYKSFHNFFLPTIMSGIYMHASILHWFLLLYNISLCSKMVYSCPSPIIDILIGNDLNFFSLIIETASHLIFAIYRWLYLFSMIIVIELFSRKIIKERQYDEKDRK